MDQLSEGYDIVVNVQGDEPLIEPEIIDEVVRALQGAPDAVYRCARSPQHTAPLGIQPGSELATSHVGVP